MSDYAAIVDRASFTHGIIPVGEKPYWSTNSGDGKICFVSVSGDDCISPISYASGREVARIAVGRHPQRMSGCLERRRAGRRDGARHVAYPTSGGVSSRPARR